LIDLRRALVSRTGASRVTASQAPLYGWWHSETNEAVEPAHYLGFHTFGTAVWGASIADRLLANFVTVHFPRNEPLWRALDDDLPLRTRLSCLGHAYRAELISVGCYRMAIRRGLWEHGYRQFLDRPEGARAGGWCIHLFLIEEGAARLLPQITTGTVGPGDPVNLDPRWFVEWRLRQIEQQHRLTGRCDWQNDDLP
jgi:hypothetical protein